MPDMWAHNYLKGSAARPNLNQAQQISKDFKTRPRTTSKSTTICEVGQNFEQLFIKAFNSILIHLEWLRKKVKIDQVESGNFEKKNCEIIAIFI